MSNRSKEIAAVASVTHIVAKQFGWLLRETARADIGVDGQIETAEADNDDSGRLIGVQIKGGGKKLHKNKKGLTYYFEERHFRYWMNYSRQVPILLIVENPADEKFYWQLISIANIEKTPTRYKILVPFSNIFDQTAKESIRYIGDNFSDLAKANEQPWFKVAIQSWFLGENIKQAKEDRKLWSKIDNGKADIEMRRKLFDATCQKIGEPKYKDFITAFERHTGIRKRDYRVTIEEFVIYIDTTGSKYEMRTEELLHLELKRVIGQKRYKEIQDSIDLYVFSAVVSDAEIDKQIFSTKLLKEWEIYWDSVFENNELTESEESLKDKKASSWNDIRMFMDEYEGSDDIINLADNMNSAVLYPLSVITFMSLLNPDVVSLEYCEHYFSGHITEIEWENIGIKDGKKEILIREYEIDP